MITVNEYFDGRVKSLGYESAEGKATIGIIDNGEYEFGTSQHETMRIIEGSLSVLLPEEPNWKIIKAGDSFVIEAGKSFKVRAEGQVSYLCKYK